MGKRGAPYCMTTMRRVFSIGLRRNLVDRNPFLKMDINKPADRETRPWTRAEYEKFKAKAKEMGHQNMATAAALAFELLQRVGDTYQAMEWKNYTRGKEIKFMRGKSKKRDGKLAVIPLSTLGEDGNKIMLYQELEDELLNTPRLSNLIVCKHTADREGNKGLPHDKDSFGKLFRRIRDAAGLPSDLWAMGWRHGGSTEVGNAGGDVIPLTDHKDPRITLRYNQETKQKAVNTALARLAIKGAAK